MDGAGFEGDQWFSFHAFVPVPRHMRRTARFRDWAISHWDTKWDACVGRPNRRQVTSVEISFRGTGE